MNKFEIGAIAVGIVSLFGVGASMAYENHQTNKKVGKSMDELKNASIRDITESMLREAVAKAADSTVSDYIRKDNDSMMSQASGRLEKEIKSLVSSRYDEVTRDVSDRLAAQVSKLEDPDVIRRTVRKRAEDILVNRFDNDLDDLKRRAEDAFDDANDRYEDRLNDAVERFEEKMDDHLERYSDNLASIKKAFDKIENAFSNGRGSRDGKEIRFTLG